MVLQVGRFAAQQQSLKSNLEILSHGFESANDVMKKRMRMNRGRNDPDVDDLFHVPQMDRIQSEWDEYTMKKYKKQMKPPPHLSHETEGRIIM
jgi:hypothetical protein